MPTLNNPFYALRRSPNINASAGFVPTTPRSPDPTGLSSIGQAIAGMVGAATYDPEMDPRAQAARKYRLEGDGLEAKASGRSSIGAMFGQLDLSSPDAMANSVQQIAKEIATSGVDAQGIGELMRFMTANTPSTTEDQIARADVGAGGGPRGPDQSYTVPRQDDIRRDDERMDKERLSTEEAGRMGRLMQEMMQSDTNNERDNGTRLQISREDPIIAAPDSTIRTVPGDKRTNSFQAPSSPNSGNSKAGSAGELKTLGEEFMKALPPDAEIDDIAVNDALNYAGELRASGVSAATAINRAIKERLKITPKKEGLVWDDAARVEKGNSDPLGIR